MRHTGEREYDKPSRHHRPEKSADPTAAPVLDRKKRHEHRRSDRNDIRAEYRRRDLEPFYRAQHRNRRGDHGVAKEQ